MFCWSAWSYNLCNLSQFRMGAERNRKLLSCDKNQHGHWNCDIGPIRVSPVALFWWPCSERPYFVNKFFHSLFMTYQHTLLPAVAFTLPCQVFWVAFMWDMSSPCNGNDYSLSPLWNIFDMPILTGPTFGTFSLCNFRRLPFCFVFTVLIGKSHILPSTMCLVKIVVLILLPWCSCGRPSASTVNTPAQSIFSLSQFLPSNFDHGLKSTSGVDNFNHFYDALH